MAISDEQTPTRHPTAGPPAVKPRLISFVLPVYNEESTLEWLHEQISRVMASLPDDHEVVFVDDGSRDRSFAVLRELRERDPKVRVVQLRRNFGKSAAYAAGFDNARGDVVITMDTDGQDDPSEIPLFLEKIDENHDMVIGWKYGGKGPIGKRVPSRFFNKVVTFITGIPLHDFNCPFKAYRRRVLEEIEVYGELHRYIPVMASARGFSIAEVKISNLPRRAGKSKFGIERYLRGTLDLLTISFITRFAKRPMHLLGTGGVLACLVGLGTILFFVVAHFLYKLSLLTDDSWNIHDRPAISLGILLMVVGIQFFSLGLLGELLVARRGAATGDRGYSVKQILED
jgi:glycosyltransferase involved in cell wall biosynthesis